MTRSRVVALLAVVGVAIAGCAGVPTHSAPQTVEELGQGAPTTRPAVAPQRDAPARTIVEDFLRANVDAANAGAARGFLTAGARTRWSPLTATVVSGESVGTYDAVTRSLVVTGRVLGTLSADGIYTPSLQGTGDGGERVRFAFRLGTVGGQYRIDSLPNGLLLTDQQFQANYRQQDLYFYDLDEQYLVPDPRYSAIADRAQLADWLLAQLANGPRPELQNAVSTDTLPAQADARHTSVELGSPTTIDIPGAGQLGGAVRNRLAAQLAETLDTAVSGGPLRVLDGADPVRIPALHGSVFTAAAFSAALGPALPSPAVYYLDNGHVVDENGHTLTGPLGNGGPYLQSVAVHDASGGLEFAGVEGTGSAQRLVTATEHGRVHLTSIHGELSRPAFAPGRSEVWVGDGSRVFRAELDPDTGAATAVATVPIPSVSGGGQVRALRISPDGSRLAMVVAGANGTAQLYVGAIVRTSGQVRIDRLDPVSPAGVVITDVAWFDASKLFAIGSLAGSGDARTFETQSDGSGWTIRGIGGLPSAPDSVTVTTDALAWVSASSFVWEQSGSSWASAGGSGQTAGVAPVYVQ